METKEKTFIPLTNDLLFKEILSSESTRDFLILFLETFTGLSKEIITDDLEVEYQKPLNKTNYYDKGIIGDVMVTFSNYIVNIEMYSSFNQGSADKTSVYGMRIFSTQLKIGEDYSNMKNFIQLNFIDNVKIKRRDKSDYKILDVLNDYEEMIPDKFEIKFYRIDKARKENYNKDIETKLLRFIGAKSEEEMLEIAKGDKILMDTIERIRSHMESDGFLETMAMWQRQGELDTIREAKEEAYNKTLEIAKNMLENNEDYNKIMKYTGLSETEIENLKNKNN